MSVVVSSEVESRQPAILSLHGGPVILDADLAAMLGVETRALNQAVKRNIERFPEGWAFQVSEAERKDLGLPPAGRGGRRALPWVFSEHGVVMATSLLKSPAAIQAMQLVVEVFIAARHDSDKVKRLLPAPSSKAPALPVPVVADGMVAKLKAATARVLDTIIDNENQVTVRQEAMQVMSEAIHGLKERLRKAGAENEEIAARATKLLAEAETEKATAAKTRAEADQIEFATLVRKLRLVMGAELLMESGDVRAFLGVLDELSK
ncbi:MAG: ORF6N domain-containing protein [Hyphomonadaceae bacterium]|nr:ORF6N domain-containing protein [Hyphomonadaceae bacterium]